MADTPTNAAPPESPPAAPPASKPPWWNRAWAIINDNLSGLQKALVTVAAIIAAVVGIVAVLPHRSSSNAPTSPPPATVSEAVTTRSMAPPIPPVSMAPPTPPVAFRGFVLAQPSLAVRTDTTSGSRVVGYLPHNSAVYIVCTAMGEPVEGPSADGMHTETTALWDKVRTDVDGPDIGFVPDAWVKTGTTAPQSAGC